MQKTGQPQTLQQAILYFSNEVTCVKFISVLKWGDDGRPFCPKCGSDNVIGLRTRPVFKCREKGCKKQFSVKVGTIFQDSALPLSKLLPALWVAANSRNGVSSCELARSLGITQKSAWHLLHRCREAMRTKSFKKLSGIIEADASYVGGLNKFKHVDKRIPSSFRKSARGNADKTVVFGMLERGGELRASVVRNEGERSIEPKIRENIEEGSTIMTDGHATYRTVAERNPSLVHESVEHSVSEYVRGQVHTNGLENFWCLFKRAIKGTYTQCAPFHVDRYLDESLYRYNQRKLSDYQRFERAVSQIFDCKLTYKELTGATASV